MAQVRPDYVLDGPGPDPSAGSRTGAAAIEHPQKLKGRKRIWQNIQRISSSPSLARMGRSHSSAYRSGAKGSMSCVSLSYEVPNAHGQACSESSVQVSAPAATPPRSRAPTPGPETNFFDPSKSRSGIRLIETELPPGAITPHSTCPVPVGLRPGSKGRLLEVTSEGLEQAHDYFSSGHTVHAVDNLGKKKDIDVWAVLPGEIRTKILRYLAPKEIIRCSAVSRSWYKSCFDGQLWRTLNASEFYRDIPAESLTKIITSAGPFVRDLNLRGCIQLQSLSKATAIASACHNLENVCLEGSRIEPDSTHFILLGNNRLVHLNLTGLSAVSNSTCKIIAQNCPLLKFLNVSWCTNMDSRGVLKLVRGCPALQDLRVGEVRGFDDEEVMLCLFETNNLERLIMNGCTSLNDNALKVLVQGRNPEICPLTNRPLVPARKLRHLDIGRCHSVTDNGVERLAYNVPDLEGLQLSGCVELSDGALRDLLPNVPKLTHLDLEELANLTNDTLKTLAKSPCKSALKHLSISYCENLGDPGMLPVIKECASLKNIDMDNTRVSDLVLIEAASVIRQRSRASSSQCRPSVGLRIVVYDCQNVTWTGVREVLSRNAEIKRPSALCGRPSYPTEIIQLKCFYGWQMTVEEHTKRVLGGDLAAASRLERKWAEYMMTNEEAGAAGAGGRRRRRRAREAAMLHADEEEGGVGLGGIGRRRRARSGGCVVM